MIEYDFNRRILRRPRMPQVNPWCRIKRRVWELMQGLNIIDDGHPARPLPIWFGAVIRCKARLKLQREEHCLTNLYGTRRIIRK